MTRRSPSLGTDSLAPSTEDLLRSFLDGAPGALGAVSGWVSAVVHVGEWRFADPEGVVQEVLIKLLRIVRAGAFRESSSFKTFVFAVAKHTCIDVYRRERARSALEGPDPGDDPIADTAAGPDEELERRERFETLRYIFQRLPEECRRLWDWVYLEGLSSKEIAARLGISEPNVRVRVHRCLTKARTIGLQATGSRPLETP